MNRFRYAIGLGALALACAVAPFVVPVFAHEGHGKVETGVFDLDAPRTISEEVAKVIELQTAEVDFGKIEDVLRVTGIVRALPTSIQAHSARVSGTVTAVHVQVGDSVQAGDVLLEMESPEYLRLVAEAARAEGEVTQLEAEVEATRQTLALAQEELRRVEANAEAVSVNTVSERRGAAVQARGAFARAEAELHRARRELEATAALVSAIRQGEETDASRAGRLQLVAEATGVVTGRTATVGAGVDAGDTLLTVGDYTKVQVEGELPESLVRRLEAGPGVSARIRLDPESDIVTVGQVRFVSPVVDPTTRTVNVLVDAENPEGRLREGQFVDVSLVLREVADAVVVPVSALLSDGPVPFVFVQEKANVFKKRNIVPGTRDDRFVEVKEGLVPGDVVATQGAYSLSQMRPKVEVAAGATQAPPAAGDGHGHTH